jgi:hypothetical protein
MHYKITSGNVKGNKIRKTYRKRLKRTNMSFNKNNHLSAYTISTLYSTCPILQESTKFVR